MNELKPFNPEIEAIEKVKELTLKKYPSALFRRGSKKNAPESKYFKVCYCVIEDPNCHGTILGYMIAALDWASETDCIIYRSKEP